MKVFMFVGFLFLTIAPQSHALIRINEIYPAPASQADEWVEIYIEDETGLELGSLILIDEKNTVISLPQILLTDGTAYFIATSSGVLNNAGDTLTLKSADDTILDTASFTGSINAAESYSYCHESDQWIKTANISKSAPNIDACIVPTHTPTPTQTTTPTMQPKPTSTPIPPTPTSKIPYRNIFITEVMVYPNPNEPEWVELFNNNPFDVHLENWQIDDVADAGSSAKSFSHSIPSKSYATITITSSMFNNGGDVVRLLDRDGVTVDSLLYSHSTKNLTWAKESVENAKLCLMSPSPNTQNTQCHTNTEPEADDVITPSDEIDAVTNRPLTTPTVSIPSKQPTIEWVVPPWYFASASARPIAATKSGEILGVHHTPPKNDAKREINGIFISSLTSAISSILTIGRIWYRIKFTPV